MKKQLLTFLSLLITGIISAQVGIGTTDPKSGLDINTSLGYKVTSRTSATTLDDTYNVVLCNSAPYTVTLPPAAANAGRVYRIKNIDPSGDAITIDGNGSETIDGESTYLLQPYKHSITLISDGANWQVIEFYNDGNFVEGAISTINCSGTNNGTLVNGVAASGVNSVLSYTGGNAGTHSGQTVTSTGVTGLTATLSAGTFTSSTGSLTYTITGTPTSSGTASFAVNIGGQTCTLTRTVSAPPTANAGAALSAICQSGTSAAMGGSVGGSATGGTWTGGAGTWTNATNPSTATYTAGASESGSITLTLTTSGGSFGTTTATKSITVNANPTANAGAALAAINQGATSAAMGGSVGGGATGGTWTGGAGTWTNASNPFTATYTAGASETGSITLTLTTSGGSCGTTTATKTITVNAASGCGNVTFTYNGASVTYGTVTGANSKCWLDRNLGATRVAQSSTDHLAYGDLFQWGRGADGHQLITRTNSTTASAVNGITTTLSSTDSPGNALFIYGGGSAYDWRSPQNNSLWQGVSGTNNPCPSGYRLPTETEIEAERNNGGTGFWGTGSAQNNATGAINSPLKLPLTGTRGVDGSFSYVGTYGYYWSSTVSGTNSRTLSFDNISYAGTFAMNRSQPAAVRCLKN